MSEWTVPKGFDGVYCGGTKLTFQNENGIYTIELPNTEMNITAVFDDIVIPVLLSAGYSRECIWDFFSEAVGDAECT